jgi:hypothetical protein
MWTREITITPPPPLLKLRGRCWYSERGVPVTHIKVTSVMGTWSIKAPRCTSTLRLYEPCFLQNQQQAPRSLNLTCTTLGVRKWCAASTWLHNIYWPISALPLPHKPTVHKMILNIFSSDAVLSRDYFIVSNTTLKADWASASISSLSLP